ncbi:PREDICTED: uncharacterized protein LOC108363278 [Rhagoletis zephyria]|uniref:uncharacterized protein LOC108363278 n=1 Tax=Rhagoletis zephyria TaxID=28612 RepID=UPI0008115737|nr:PREDICTED: uncharacterized protein LOC108363278 [Rhagoletis zephyria]
MANQLRSLPLEEAVSSKADMNNYLAERRIKVLRMGALPTSQPESQTTETFVAPKFRMMENGNTNRVPKPAPRSNNGVPTLLPRSSSGTPIPKPRASSSGGPTPAPRTVQKPQQEAMVIDIVPDTQPDDEGADYLRCRLCARHPRHVFRAMQPAQRYLIARAHHFCTNCLALSHHSSECPSAGVCRLCAQRHHTLLHRKNTSQAPFHRHIQLQLQRHG